MRNTEYTDNFSVEIYLKKHESFMHAYNKVDYKELNKDQC